MENLILIGINTRPMINSALKLDYNVISISYFKTLDFKKVYMEKYVLDQEKVDSCGNFENNYDTKTLIDLFKEIDDEGIDIDKIVFTSEINFEDFEDVLSKHKNKIRSNLKTNSVDDKFKFYNKIKKEFNVPLTFKVNDIYEINEIINNYDNLNFILKPINGSGGLGIIKLNNDSLNSLNEENNIFENIDFDNCILQEYIEGTTLSSSVLSSKTDVKNLINTRLITEQDLNNENNFTYSGNICPLDFKSFNQFQKRKLTHKSYLDRTIINLNKIMGNLSESLIKKFKLIGSNGVDFILKDDVFYNGSNQITEDELIQNLNVIEINPRLQGTFELCEQSLGINLLDAHIKACEGELVDIPDIKKYTIKKIVYSKKQITIGDLNLKNVYDIPYKGVKIEKNQPVVTLISSNTNLDAAIEDIRIANNNVNKNIT